MPEEGVELSPSSELLTGDEMVRLASLFVSQGVNKIRLTGGEPLLRRDLLDIICKFFFVFYRPYIRGGVIIDRSNQLLYCISLPVLKV